MQIMIEEGSQKLYQGPGTKYGEVPGVRDIENGETLHITQDAELVDGSHWGVTTVDGKEGWMDLEKTEEWQKEHPETTDANTDALAADVSGNAISEETPAAEPSVTPAVTEAAATETPAPTEAAATETPAPTEAAATETPVPTEAAVTETPAPSATEEISDTKDSKQASGQNVKIAEKKWYQSPFTWSAVIAALAVAGLLIYHNKKK